MDKKTLRSADVLTSIILIAAGIWISIYSIGLSAETTDPFLTSSGFLPLVGGVLLIVMSIAMLVNGLREGGSLKLFAPQKVWNAIISTAGRNTLFIYAWIAIYVFVLMRILPYFLSTLIFTVIFSTRYYKKNTLTAILVSVIATLVITAMFGGVAKIPLPGI